MAVAATERAVDMSIFGVRLPFSSGATGLGIGRGAFLPMGGGGTRLGCFLVGGGDAVAGFATILELLTTVTLDLGDVFFALGFEEPEDFLLDVFFSGFFFDTNEILCIQIHFDRPRPNQWLQYTFNDGCAIVVCFTTQVNPVTREGRSYVSQYCVFFQIEGAPTCQAQCVAVHGWNPQSNLEVDPRSPAGRDARRRWVLE